ncbi:murein biosynthesis integral membrane protein MurJ [Rhodococcus sp. NPDC058514]|uniref:murein biosynthesis integral membrane protein MurJ n=1 Tax=unclassified Rhodococcus (in: high G+C Gram-positive bacteria) TaxID=192944 RepID=UPI00364B4B32
MGKHRKRSVADREHGTAQAGGAVALATAVSRITGFVRTAALAAVLGTAAVADAYNGANSFPNMVYALLLGGILTSIVIPLLTRARARGVAGELEFTQRLLSAATVAMAAITVVAVLCTPLLTALFVDDSAQRVLATFFAYLLLPEIFFYGLTALLTAVLNVRGIFGPGAWAPVVNNIIVLVTVGAFVLLPGPLTLTPTSMTAAQVATLGAGTGLGIAVQAGWVVMALRRTGFRWRWRGVRLLPYTWRPVRRGLPLLGWVMAYVVTSQIGVAVVLKVAFSHGGVSTYTYADLLFQVPYGILGVSLLTVLMPRISRAAADGDRAAILSDLGRGARYSVVALVPVTVAMTLLGPALSTVIFVGRVEVADARLIGTALAVSAFGLVPLAIVMLQLRVFYAGNDLRTPALINVAMVATKIVVVLVASATLPDRGVVLALCVAGSVSYLAGATLGHYLLRRRYGLLGFHHVRDTAMGVGTAAVIAGTACFAVVRITESYIPDPRSGAAASLFAGTLTALIIFAIAAKAIGIPEIRHARAILRR